jgi:plasmid stability protein
MPRQNPIPVDQRDYIRVTLHRATAERLRVRAGKEHRPVTELVAEILDAAVASDERLKK